MTTTQTNLTRKQIKQAFEALDRVFYAEMTNHAQSLLDQCKAEEKQHRRYAIDRCAEFNKYHPEAITITESAMLFAVKRVAEYILHPDNMPKGKDYLHFQKSAFIAAGIADEFGRAVAMEWAKSFLTQDTLINRNALSRQFSELDYTDYVKAVAPVTA